MRSKVAAFAGLLALGAIVSVYLSYKIYAQQSPMVLYDNFDEKFLSPLKWNTYGACYTNNGMELECVREIRDESLHLAHRNFGNRDTNSGFQSGSANVSFVNPSGIKSITTDLVVRRIEEAA